MKNKNHLKVEPDPDPHKSTKTLAYKVDSSKYKGHLIYPAKVTQPILP